MNSTTNSTRFDGVEIIWRLKTADEWTTADSWQMQHLTRAEAALVMELVVRQYPGACVWFDEEGMEDERVTVVDHAAAKGTRTTGMAEDLQRMYGEREAECWTLIPVRPPAV